MGNIDQVHRYYECVDTGNVNGLIDLFAPDAVYDRPGYPTINGRAELAEFYDGQRVIKSGVHTLRHVTADGSDVAVHGEFSGTLKDERQVSLRFADFFTLARDGLISRRITFFFTPMV